MTAPSTSRSSTSRSSSNQPPKTQAQRRAAHALAAVRRIEQGGEDPKTVKRFRQYAQKLPAMIQTNGLGQTAAFCRSRVGKKTEIAYFLLYEILSDWLTGDGQPYASSDGASSEGGAERDLLRKITESSMGEYRAAQREALAYLQWLKDLAMAFLVAGTASDGAIEHDADAVEAGGGDG